MMKSIIRYTIIMVGVTQSMFALFDLKYVNSKNIINCNSGDNVTNITGENNQVQVVRTGCDSRIGSTADAVVFAPEELPRYYSSITTNQKINELAESFPRNSKTLGYKVTKKVNDRFGKETSRTTTLLLVFTDNMNGTAQLATYTSAPWAGQISDTWTRRLVVPFNVSLRELSGEFKLQFDAAGIVKIILGDPLDESLQLNINLFDPRAV